MYPTGTPYPPPQNQHIQQGYPAPVGHVPIQPMFHPQVGGASPYPPQAGGYGEAPITYPAMGFGGVTHAAAPLPSQATGGQFPAPGGPSAPNQNIQTFPGYKDSSFTPTIQPPENPYWQPAEPQVPTSREIPSTASISLEEVKAALKAFAASKTCYGPTDDFQINENDIEMKSAFHYKLISFTEQRETVWKFEPYKNQKLEGPNYGQQVPGPWSIPYHPTTMFKKETKEIVIPNTTSMRPCHTCLGMGKSACTRCSGSGGKNCTWCSGTGKRFVNDACDHCPNSSGRERCTNCQGNGVTNCTTCQGQKTLYFYLQLIINWKPQEDEFVSDTTLVPQKKFSKASGIRAVGEMADRVIPITNFPDNAINKASQEMINNHLQKYGSTGLIIKQEQTVDIIRIAKVNYTWKTKTGSFVVFGQGNCVYFPDYPQKCHCCTII